VGGKVVALHQPNYVPWAGYFHKLAGADVFVYLDSVQFPRGRSFAARNRIKTPSGVTYLTVPVSIPRGREGKVTYLEVRFADDRWRETHLRTIEHSYRRAPHFDDVYSLYQTALDRAETFTDLTIGLIETFASYLGIETQRVRLSELGLAGEHKARLVLDICLALGAGVYLSGSGGSRDYNDEELLRAHGIELRYDVFHPPEYPQLWEPPFEPNLSILDLLFNCGPASRALLASG
jgi:hypothetical protein